MARDKNKEKKSFSGFFKNLRRPSEAIPASPSHQAGSSEPSSLPTPTVTSEPSAFVPHSSNSSRNAESSPMPRKAIGLIELTGQDECSGPASERGWADIVAIHGIGGDAYRTWTASNGALWLSDFLPKDIENVRVFSFGYDARVWPTRAKGTVESFARSLLNDLRIMWMERGKEERPLIFVCHSMGGIVLKKAFIIARLSSEGEYPFMRQSVKGIIFMGTPHQGSEAVKWPQLLANLVDFGLYFGSSWTGKTRKDLLEDLAKDSKPLELMATEFVNQIGEIQIVSCVEQRATPPLSSEIVCRQSALLNLPGERIIMMDGCDHRTMCQFPNVLDRNYRRIRSEIKELLGLL
ncbi:uncharacterized protein BDR25DRAFT_343591 [Lindgomyces ingoldianus]|uniref:Uncharacterized protein n=1 Tax=Lindgomyces ingoldianus TaxID=673940 RepID=A0ACB6QTS8_9PLEO|nr:uncharacterized protein BDR25DRAFT_343591 [Lindgomyces ingoldianus]KAF2469566.1 hypothetical protein BDR25DRAFT_343591 [Lindgomyces ingoldianus]